MKNADYSSNHSHVLIFGTNIQDEQDVKEAGFALDNYASILKWTVDLHDWERVLKIEAQVSCSYYEVEQLIGNLGYECKELTH